MSTCLKGKKNLEEAATKTKHNFTTFVLKKTELEKQRVGDACH